MLLTEHLQRNPTYEKGKGRPLPAQGTQLANLTTVKLSRKKMSENLRPNVCGKYALLGSSRALYNPLDPTHKQCTWPVPFHEVGCAVLISSGGVKNGSLLGWSDLVVWCGGGVLIWWADFGGLVWQWSGGQIWDSSDCLMWWSDLGRIILWVGWCGLVPWPNLEVWLRKMVWSGGWKFERWEAEEIVVKRL